MFEPWNPKSSKYDILPELKTIHTDGQLTTKYSGLTTLSAIFVLTVMPIASEPHILRIAFRVLCIALALSCSPLLISAQHKLYDITVAGISIGNLDIKRYDKAELTYYEMSTKISFWLFFRVEADYAMTAVYKGDQMISSKSQTHTNKGDFTSSTVWNGRQYEIHIDAYKYKKDTLISEPIRFNVGRMYFDKPTPGQKIYADNFGLLTPAVKDEDQIIVRILGNANRYYYQKDVMYEASMYHPVKNYRVKMITAKQ
ncbi:MAG: hypothetical protein QM762_21310 [Chryseolinea sp.]